MICTGVIADFGERQPYTVWCWRCAPMFEETGITSDNSFSLLTLSLDRACIFATNYPIDGKTKVNGIFLIPYRVHQLPTVSYLENHELKY